MSSSAPRVIRKGIRTDWVRFDAALARDGSVDPTDKALYAAIASFVDEESRKTIPHVSTDISHVPADVPTRRRLAECIGRSVFTVDRSTKRLEQLGVLRVRRQTHPDTKTNLPSEYELLPYRPPAAVTPAVVKVARKRVPISAAKRLRVLARDGYKCLGCGTSEDLTVDHIQHWSRGGTNDDENLRVLCRPCNSRRNDGALEGVDGGTAQ